MSCIRTRPGFGGRVRMQLGIVGPVLDPMFETVSGTSIDHHPDR